MQPGYVQAGSLPVDPREWIHMDNKRIAEDVLAAIGGRENVANAAHCMTRLRFTLKDEGIPNTDEVARIKGVLGAQFSGGQYQVIVGQNVPKVYHELCALGGFAEQGAIDENLDTPKQRLTPKAVGRNIMNYLSGSMMPMIPAMIVAGMFKMLQAILGPSMMGIVSETDDFYLLMDFMYQAFFYFLPVFLGYTAAKHLKVTPVLGMLIGCILIVPGFVQLATEGASFSVYGIPCTPRPYAQTVLPALLSVWVMMYVERFFKKIVPEILSTLFTPFLTIAVMTPVAYCLLAPIGAVCGDAINGGLLAFGDSFGFIAVAIVAALWQFLVLTGMHAAVLAVVYAALATNGVDNFILVAAIVATWATYGMALGSFLRLHGDDKMLSLGYFVSAFVGGVTEPAMYGIAFRYKRPFAGIAAGGFAGGLIAGIMHLGVYTPGSANVLNLLRFVNGGTTNLIGAIISCLIAMIAAAAVTYLFGFSREDVEESRMTQAPDA